MATGSRGAHWTERARLLLPVRVTAAARAGIALRATWQFGGVMANAFAFPLTGELAVSDRLLEVCSDEEIAAVRWPTGEPNVVLAGRLLSSLYLPLIFITPLLNRFAIAGLVLAFLSVVAIRGFAGWLTRQMERRADQVASTTTTNEGVYASALEKIYRENQFRAVNAGRRRPHLDLYDRCSGLEQCPTIHDPTAPRA